MQQQDIRYSYWCCVTIWMMILSVRTTLTFEYNHNELSLSSSSWPSAFLQISERIIICCLTMSKPQLFPPLWQGISNNDELWTHFRGSVGKGWVELGCMVVKLPNSVASKETLHGKGCYFALSYNTNSNNWTLTLIDHLHNYYLSAERSVVQKSGVLPGQRVKGHKRGWSYANDTIK